MWADMLLWELGVASSILILWTRQNRYPESDLVNATIGFLIRVAGISDLIVGIQ